jgi:hypothetical protein
LVQSSEGLESGVAKRVDDLLYNPPFRLRDRPESLRDALPGGAEIALAAGALRVRKVSKMAHQGLHAALMGFRVAPHQFQLRAFLFQLR